MKKIVKIVAILLGVVIVAVFAVLIAAKIIITPERVRQTVVPMAEKQLKRPVSIGNIDVHLFSGIEINDFLVKTKDGRDTFISANALVLRYRFLPLLRLQVILDEARLEGPNIRIIRFQNGQFNFSDLLERKPAEQPPPKQEPSPQTGGGPPISFVIDELRISGGEVLFTDQSLGPPVHEYHLTDLALKADQFELNKPFPMGLDARVNGAPLSVTGTADLQAPAIDARIKLSEFNVPSFMPLIAGKFPGKISSAALSLDLTLSGDKKNMTSSGRITADNINMVLNSMPDAPVEGARLGFNYQVSADTVAKTVRIGKGDVDINGIPASLTGTVTSYAREPKLDMNAKLPPIDLADVLRAVPKGLAKKAADMRPAGRISADVNLGGGTANPKTIVRDGQIRLDAVQISINKFNASAAGLINLKNDSLTARGLNLRLNDNAAVLDIEASNLMGKPVLISSKLAADTLNIDQLTAAAKGAEKPAKGKKPTPEKKGPAGPPPAPVRLPLTADGTVNVRRAIYQKMNIDNFEMQYRLENNVLTINRMNGQTAGGTVSGKLRADLNKAPMAYETSLTIDGTRTNEIVSALFPRAANTVFGNLFINMGLTGAGTAWDDVSRNLAGNADLSLTDGRVTGSGFTQGLAGFLNLPELKVLNFESIKGDLQLQQGKFNVKSDYNSSNMAMTPTGTIGLDGSLNLALNMRLSPELATRIGNKNITKLLQDQKGWALVPVKVGGNTTAPRFSLDTGAVQQQLQQKAQESFKKKLEKELQKKLPQEKGSEKDGDQPPVDQLLDKLFKK